MEGITQQAVSTEFKKFHSLYKYKNVPSSQERREEFLQEQKEKRHRLADENRKQFELFIKSPVNDDDTLEMDYEELQNKKEKFQFVLMKTDWFTDIPEDLEEHWLVKCAPVGFRVMLVSRNRQTICYNSRGKVILKLKSNFSSGGGSNAATGTTILDCIYNKQTKSMFILDCLCWNNMSMIDSDAEFRFYWLNSKFSDEYELSHCKKFKFVLVNCFPAQRTLIQDAMFQRLTVGDHQYCYDGIVFYHKQSHYYFSNTPLVGWLASYMLTEVLQIDVAEEHIAKRPEGYNGIFSYIENLQLRTKPKYSSKKPGKQMDTI